MTMAAIVRPRNTSSETRRRSVVMNDSLYLATSACCTICMSEAHMALLLKSALSIGVIAAIALCACARTNAQPAPAAVRGLTAVQGLKVGHHTLTARPTGCTVVVAEAGAVAGVDIRGGAP